MAKKKSRKVSNDKLVKQHIQEETIQGFGNLEVVRPINATINFPDLGSKGGDGSNFDFTPHYGQGFDDIVNRVFYTAKALVKSNIAGDGSQKTTLSYLVVGFTYLASYLPLYRHKLGHDLTQDDISLTLINNFRTHLKTMKLKRDTSKNLSYKSQKNNYTHSKSLLMAMKGKGYWDATPECVTGCFPKNPYPKSNKRGSGGASPFTQHEKKQLVIALKQAIKPIIKEGREEPLSSYEISVLFLAVAMQTGINITPLLEMTVDSLSDHP